MSQNQFDAIQLCTLNALKQYFHISPLQLNTLTKESVYVQACLHAKAQYTLLVFMACVHGRHF